MAMNVEAVIIVDKLESMATTVTLQPRSFACPHCGKPIEVDSVLNALSSSDLARAMRDRRKRQLTPESGQRDGQKECRQTSKEPPTVRDRCQITGLKRNDRGKL